MSVADPRPAVVVTQAEEGESSLAAALGRLGAEVQQLPTIAVLPAVDTTPLEGCLARLASFDWLIFTSRHAVDAACGSALWPRRGAFPQRPRIAVVGRATETRLSLHGQRPDLVPEHAGGADLARALLEREAGRADLRVLWPRSDIARPELPTMLRAAGVTVEEPIAYRTVPFGEAAGEEIRDSFRDRVDELRHRIERREVAAITFMSPSSARHLAAAFGRRDLALLRGKVLVASIGPTTSEALATLGAAPDVEAGERSSEGLATSLMAALATLSRSSHRGSQESVP